MVSTTKQREPLWWFPIRGGPKIRMDKEWSPLTPDELNIELFYQGFIVPEHWAEDDLNEFPKLMQDLRDLDEYLLPAFFEYNHKARYYQNRYYLFQWIFLFGAFFTTILAVLTTYFTALEARSMDGMFTPLGTEINADLVVSIFGYATLIVSAITSYYTLLSNRGEPRQRWATYRRLTEELRMMYYKYVSRLEPFHTEARVDMLRRRVLDIRRRETKNG